MEWYAVSLLSKERKEVKLEGKHLSFQYDNGNRKILNNVSLSLESGERLGMAAPSGFGKTTCCKILSGYEKPDSGQVLLDGKPLLSYKGYCPVQMVWQHPELAVNPKKRMKKILREGDQIEEDIIQELGIEKGWMNRFPGELSAGELQRFCIARALGRRTKFLLADEITAMLDMITQSQIWRFLIRESERREIGILVVSHSEELLKKVCTRRVFLKEFC